MRAGKNTKTYGGTIGASPGADPVNVVAAPSNPRRTMLLIQNTGAGILLCRFGSPVLNDGTDLIFPASSAAGLLWDKPETCPESSINFGSIAGTTYSVTEQVTS